MYEPVRVGQGAHDLGRGGVDVDQPRRGAVREAVCVVEIVQTAVGARPVADHRIEHPHTDRNRREVVLPVTGISWVGRAHDGAEVSSADTARRDAQSVHALWGVVVGKLFESLQTGLKGDQIRDLERIASILDRAQKGQRLARGLSLDGKTEEQIRAEFEAEGRGLIDFFMDLVKDEIDDETVRDRLARAILEQLPTEEQGIQ